LGVPEEDIVVKALGSKTAQNGRKIKSVSLLGSDEKLAWTQTRETLTIGRPVGIPSSEAVVFKVVFR
jgi:alpha-L-fucosidase